MYFNSNTNPPAEKNFILLKIYFQRYHYKASLGTLTRENGFSHKLEVGETANHWIFGIAQVSPGTAISKCESQI